MKGFLRLLMIIAPFFIKYQKPFDFPVLKGDYLGQNLAGDTAKVFAPGIISMDITIEHGAPGFSPIGKVLFFYAVVPRTLFFMGFN